tara:strand:+ start:71 stop:277 length:207 start_codon:yes stop_codon:yes gene_type:complete
MLEGGIVTLHLQEAQLLKGKILPLMEILHQLLILEMRRDPKERRLHLDLKEMNHLQEMFLDLDPKEME